MFQSFPLILFFTERSKSQMYEFLYQVLYPFYGGPSRCQPLYMDTRVFLKRHFAKNENWPFQYTPLQGAYKPDTKAFGSGLYASLERCILKWPIFIFCKVSF